MQGQVISRSNIFSYNVNDGLLQTSIIDNAVDQNNFLWLSYPNGIQKFDGNKFTTVEVQTGLPDDKEVFFFRTANNHFLISHSKGISIWEPARNKFRELFRLTGELKPFHFIGEDGNLVYLLSKDGVIYTLHNISLTAVFDTDLKQSSFSFDPNYQPYPVKNIRFHRVILRNANAACLWDLKEKRAVSSMKLPPDADILFDGLANDHSFRYYDRGRRDFLKAYDFNAGVTNTVTEIPVENIRAFRSRLYHSGKKTLYSVRNHLFEADSNLNIIAEMVDFANNPVSGLSSISGICEDNYGNLYATTLNEGLKKIIRNNYPVKYFGGVKEQKTYALSILPNKGANRILAGTYGNGLLVFDTSQHLIKHIKNLPGSQQDFSAYVVLKNVAGDYILFCNGYLHAWKLSSNLARLTKLEIEGNNLQYPIGYYCNIIYSDANMAIICGERSILKADLRTNRITAYNFPSANMIGATLFENRIVTHENDYLVFIDTVSFQKKPFAPLKNTGGVRCMIGGKSETLYVGTNKGIFLVSGRGGIIRHLTKQNGLPDECIYAMGLDDKGLLWCSTNKGIFRLNADNSIFLLKKEDGLQENEFNTNVVAKASDGEIFFGGVNGVSSFFSGAMNNVREKMNLLVTGIRVNNIYAYADTAAWLVNRIDLPFDKNSLAFDFIAMGSSMPTQYIYQYRMKGVDNTWIQNDGLQTVRYLLPPGEYVFQLKASRTFGIDALPAREIFITIRPPFWRTWWFISAIVLLSGGFLIYSINRYNRRKYMRKLYQKENEYRLQSERERISRDLHDNIGAYANAVLYNTELLQRGPAEAERAQLMADLKFASKDIITALRESVWALKKDEYTAQECLLRIVNFMQPFNRYYPRIRFRNEEKAVPDISLLSAPALNMVRIIQEAVTNAIKHASAKNIVFQSDVKNGKWVLSITDDGTGFNTAEAPELQQGNGLNNIRQRSAAAGFDFQILSSAGKGTAVIITVPADHTANQATKL